MSSLWKILIAIVVTVLVVGSGTYYYMNKKANSDKAKLQSSIDDLNKQVKDLQAAAEKSSASTSTATQQATGVATTTAVDPYLYTNSTYGFSLTFNSKWKNYEVVAVNSDVSSALKYLYVCVPTASTTWQDKKAGVFCPFAITVVAKANKTKFEQDSEPIVPTFVLSNSSYSFYYSTAQDRPTDGESVMNDVKNIIATFK